jgi:hypothetical protein
MSHIVPILGRLNLTSVNFGPTVRIDHIRRYLPHAVIYGQLAPFTFSRNDEAGIVAIAGGGLVSCGRTGGGPSWRFFTAAEARTVNAICSQIIPADDFPGASEAGVVNFIDLQLTKHYKKHRDAYRRGIANVDETPASAPANRSRTWRRSSRPKSPQKSKRRTPTSPRAPTAIIRTTSPARTTWPGG